MELNMEEVNVSDSSTRDHQLKAFNIIGCGPNDHLFLTEMARWYIDNAQIISGSSRLLSLYSKLECEQIPVTANMDEFIAAIQKAFERNIPVTILVTGDTGVASLASVIVKRFGRENCLCIPGISSVQLACARLCIEWGDALIINSHKSIPVIQSDTIQSFKTILTLSGNKSSWPWIVTTYQNLISDYTCHLCCNLGHNEESIKLLLPDEFSLLPEGGGNCIFVWQRKDTHS
jgi:cobalt-precorrin-7 (C5)-methyltransferase